MKKMLTVVIAILLLGLSGPAFSAQEMPIGVVSPTFDDGNLSSDIITGIVKMYQNGIPGTFYIVPDWIGDNDGHFTWEHLLAIDSVNWEIGNHTQSHQHPDDISNAEFVSQIDLAEQTLRTHGILQVGSLAVPYGEGYNLSNGKVVLDPAKSQGIKGLGYVTTARQAFTGDNPTILNYVADFDPLALRVWSWKQSTPESKIIGLIDQAAAEKAWLVLVIHVIAKYPDPSDNDQISLDMFLRVCDHIKALADQGRIVPKTVSKGAGMMTYYKNLP
jgi:peptidoglycan/xylan/chitin deacetylase (PgdA/CDA1 family)